MIPGEVFVAKGDIVLNEGRQTITLRVANSGDRPVQVGSHYHFAETNPALEFDRDAARGMRLNIAAGTAVRFVDVVHPQLVAVPYEVRSVRASIDRVAGVFGPGDPVGAGGVLHVVRPIAAEDHVPQPVLAEQQVTLFVAQQGRRDVEIVALTQRQQRLSRLREMCSIVRQRQTDLISQVLTFGQWSDGAARVEQVVTALVFGDCRGEDVVRVEGLAGAERKHRVVRRLDPAGRGSLSGRQPASGRQAASGTQA